MLPGRITVEDVKKYRELGLPGVVYKRRFYTLEELEDLGGIKRTKRSVEPERKARRRGVEDGLGDMGGAGDDTRESEPSTGEGPLSSGENGTL